MQRWPSAGPATARGRIRSEGAETLSLRSFARDNIQPRSKGDQVLNLRPPGMKMVSTRESLPMREGLYKSSALANMTALYLRVNTMFPSEAVLPLRLIENIVHSRATMHRERCSVLYFSLLWYAFRTKNQVFWSGFKQKPRSFHQILCTNKL